MSEGWTVESVLKKHNLWRPLAGPDAGATATTLQWQDMQIEKLREALGDALRYAQHAGSCHVNLPNRIPCDCGLQEVLDVWHSAQPKRA